MPLLVRGFNGGVDIFVGPLVLLAWQRALGSLGNSDIPFRDIPDVLPGFN